MTADPQSDPAQWRAMCDAHGAFWQDAGVDLAFADDARDWLADADEKRAATEKTPLPPPVELPAARPIGPAPPPVPDMAKGREGWPATLAAFAPWWLMDPALDSGPLNARVAPRGEQGAPLMVIVAQPETGDSAGDASRLLSGPEGALLDAIERAMGYPAGAAYRASALPRVTPAADWSALAEAGMGELLHHHIELAAPERLLVLSREALALLRPDVFGDDGTGHVIIGDRQVRLMAAYPLGQMLSRPGFKRIFWHRWLAFAKSA